MPDSTTPPSASQEADPQAPEGAAAAGAGRSAEYWREEARKAFARRDEVRKDLAAAMAEAARSQSALAGHEKLVAELAERKLGSLPAHSRRLVPESLPAAEKLRYLIENEELLVPRAPARAVGPDMPAAGPGSDRPFELMGYMERAELYHSDPERYRRAAAAAAERGRPAGADRNRRH